MPQYYQPPGPNMMNSHMSTNVNVYVEKLIMTPVKERYNMVQRSMRLNVNNHDLNNIYQLYDQNKSGKISAIDVSKVVPNVMKINDAPDRNVNIINGWGTERYRFLLVCVSQMSNGSIFRSHIQGYSDYAEKSFSNQIDPKITLFFNSMINTVTTRDPVSGMGVTRVHSAFNIIYDTLLDSYAYQEDNNVLRLLRPQDVINEMQIFNTYGAGEQVLNMTSRRGTIPSASKGANRIGASHLADTLNAFNTAKLVSGIGYDDDDIFTNAQASVSEFNLNNIPLIMTLSNELRVMTPGSASLEKLERISPNLNERTFLSQPSEVPFSDTALFTNDTEDLSQITIEASIASMVADMATGMMMDNLLTSITFSMTNMNFGSELGEIVMDFNSVIPDIDKTAYIQRFMASFKNIAMPQITQNNLIGVEITATIDIMSSARVQVLVSGNNIPIVYNIPLYADSLFTSVVSSKEQHDRSITEYTNLINMITQ